MKTIVAFVLLSCLTASAQLGNVGFLASLKPAAAGGATYLIEEGFEETDMGGGAGSGTDGYDSALFVGETGTPNNDYATSPAPLVGTYSGFLDSSGAVAQAMRWDLSAAQSELYIYFKVSDASLPANSTQFVLELTTSAGTRQAGLYFRTDGTIRLIHGTVLGTATVGTMSASTTYHVWVHWKNDGTGDIGFSTDGTRPTSGNNYQSMASGDGTSTVTRVYLRASELALQTAIVDRLLVSTSAIGDNP